MTEVELTVVDSGQHHDSSRVELTESQMNKIGGGDTHLLSGDRVTVVGPEGEFSAHAWPSNKSNGHLPLSKSQMSDIGAVEGTNVKVKKSVSGVGHSSYSEYKNARTRNF